MFCKKMSSILLFACEMSEKRENGPTMNIVLCGSGTFALEILKALMASDHEVTGVVTPVAHRAGRGRRVRHTPVEDAALKAGLHVLACEDINDDVGHAFLRSCNPESICVVEFGQFLKQDTCQIATHGAFNLHASILPELRGAGPIQWSILRGDERTGVTTFELVDKMDAGPILRAEELPIGPEERASELRERLAELACGVVIDTLNDYESGHANAVEQDQDHATFAPMLKKSDGWLDFTQPAEDVLRVIRGTYPWPGAHAKYICCEGKKTIDVAITRARLAEGIADVPPGEIEPGLTIATGRGRLEILELKPAGKREMDWKAFCNGYRVLHGGKFQSPSTS
jgi:methionyl-tRNA formyltransferase